MILINQKLYKSKTTHLFHATLIVSLFSLSPAARADCVALLPLPITVAVGTTCDNLALDGLAGNVTNNGTITGVGTNAISNNLGTITALTNTGVINSSFNGIDNTGVVTTFSNTGTVFGSLSGFSNEAGATLTTLSSAGGTISGGQSGIYSSGIITTITDDAGSTIDGGTGFGIFNLGGITTFATAGVITGATAGFFNGGGALMTTLTNSGTVSSAGTGIVNDGTFTTLTNTGAIISTSDNAITASGTFTTLTNGDGTFNGTIVGGQSGIVSSGLITTLSNNAGAQLSGTALYGLDNTGLITTLNNGGIITGGVAGILNASGGTIGTFTNGIGGSVDSVLNYGTFIGPSGYGIVNAGTIGSLTNAQGGTSTSALTISGNLPSNYRIFVTSTVYYGQLNAGAVSGTMSFGIASGSTLAANTYLSVLTGTVPITASGAYSNYLWTLIDTDADGTLDLVVTAAPPTLTTLALTSSSTAPEFGATVTFTATLTPTAGTGTITFKDGATTIGTGTLGAGVASFSSAALSVGAHTITATYGGDSIYAASTSNTVTVTVASISSTLTATTSNATPTAGESVTFTASLSPTSGTGTVTFKDGTTTLGTGTLSAGIATFSTATLTVGAHTITMVYAGDSTHDPATSNAITVTIATVTSTLALMTSPTAPAFGTTVTFTATLTPSTGTGMIIFKDGPTTLGTGTLAGGVASFSMATLTVGAHTITAIYGGDSIYTGSTSSALTISVTTLAGSTSLLLTTLTPAPRFGEIVVLVAKIEPIGATGLVTFKDGDLTLGTQSLIGGTVTTTVRNLSNGGHSITAIYGGDGAYMASTSNLLNLIVLRANPANDQSIKRLVSAQISSVQRLATNTMDSISQRMELLHTDETPGFVNGFGLSGLTDLAPDPCQSDWLNSASTNLIPSTDCARTLTNTTKTEAAIGATETKAAGQIRPDANIWTSGSLILGTQADTNAFKLSGVSVGVDARVLEHVKLGANIGFSVNNDTIDGSGSASQGRFITGTVYASWQVARDVFVDGLVGYGDTHFSIRRFDSSASGFLVGERTGGTVYGSVNASIEQKFGSFSFAPYAGVQFTSFALNAYTETGFADAAFVFGRTAASSGSAILGLHAKYDLITPWGKLSPTGRIEYRELATGEVNQAINYASDPSTLYDLMLPSTSSNSLTIGVGLSASGRAGLSGTFNYLNTVTATGSDSSAFRGIFALTF